MLHTITSTLYNRGSETVSSDFIQNILNWTIDQLSEPLPLLIETQPLPSKYSSCQEYYTRFLNLILEETRASLYSEMLRSRIEESKTLVEGIKTIIDPDLMIYKLVTLNESVKYFKRISMPGDAAVCALGSIYAITGLNLTGAEARAKAVQELVKNIDNSIIRDFIKSEVKAALLDDSELSYLITIGFPINQESMILIQNYKKARKASVDEEYRLKIKYFSYGSIPINGGEKFKHSFIHEQPQAYKGCQLGWNCFDIAVGITDESLGRRRIVQYALDNANDSEFRRLLAPEIRHAAALTVSYMLIEGANNEDEIKNVIALDELFQIYQTIDANEQYNKFLIEQNIQQIFEQKKQLHFPAACLPESLRTDKLKNIVVQYQQAHENIRGAVASCNDELGLGEGQRKSLEELDDFLEERKDQECYQAIYRRFKEAKDGIYTPHEQEFEEYCQQEGTYKQYVEGYYGKNNWFAFQRRFAGENTSTSMIDIVAKMLGANIVIYQEENVIYRTTTTNITEINPIEIIYSGNNHFISKSNANEESLVGDRYKNEGIPGGEESYAKLFIDGELDSHCSVTQKEKNKLLQLIEQEILANNFLDQLVDSKVIDYINHTVIQSGFWLGVIGNSFGVIRAVAQIHRVNFRVFSINGTKDTVTNVEEVVVICQHISDSDGPIHNIYLQAEVGDVPGVQRTSWHFDLLQEISPFMQEFMLSSDILVEQKIKTLVSSTIQNEETTKVKILELIFVKFKQAKNDQNPSCITFTVSNQIVIGNIQHNDVFILEDLTGSIRLISLSCYSHDPNKIMLKVIVKKEFFNSNKEFFNPKIAWKATNIGSIISNLRIYEVCIEQPQVTWLQQIYTGEIISTDLQLSDPIIEQLSVNINANEQQRLVIKKFLTLQEGIQLVQGPPGTGKTTLIVNLLKLLVSQGRVLVCAPSNKAVQVLAIRLVEKYPEIPAILVANINKHSIENMSLSKIFLDTWHTLKLNRIFNIKRGLGYIYFFMCKCAPLSDAIAPQTIYLFLEENDHDNDLKYICKNNVSGEIQIISISEPALTIYSKLKDILQSLRDLQVELPIEYLSDFYKFTSTNGHTKPINPDKIMENYFELIAEIKKYDLDFIKKMPFEITQENQMVTESLLKNLNFLEYNLKNKVAIGTQLLNKSFIIFATLNIIGRNLFKKIQPINSLIVDEAGQSVEAETLIPFTMKPKKILIIGDTKQLPATVISKRADQLKFSRSLMWRLLEECNQPYEILTEQYRMVPEISRWPSNQYYGGRLVDAEIVKSVPKYILPFLGSYVFINVKGQETFEQCSYQNYQEVIFVEKLFKFLNSSFTLDSNTQIGVITFYRAQVALLKSKGIKAQTVDGFQGDEKDFIIISFVRANQKGSIGFVKDFRRLNVALTRAKYSLIMLGDAQTLEKSYNKDVALLIRDAKERGCFVEQKLVAQKLLSSSKKDFTGLSSEQQEQLSPRTQKMFSSINSGKLEKFEKIVANVPDINCCNIGKKGDTALMTILRSKKLREGKEISRIQILLKYGASWTIKNKVGETAEDLVKKHNQHLIASLKGFLLEDAQLHTTPSSPEKLILPGVGPTSSVDPASPESVVHFKSGLALSLAQQHSHSNTSTSEECSLSAIMSSNSFVPLSSTVMLFSDAQKVSNLSTIKKETIIIDSLSLFLNHVTFGRQDKAEEMLCQNNDLVLMSGDITDCAKRKFKQVTGFQYAVWALDWHMWEMLRKYIPTETIKEQLMGLKTGSWIKDHGTLASWQDLIDELQKYVDCYKRWTYEQRKIHWCQQVGGKQLLLPAHVMSVYNQSSRLFDPCPDFLDLIRPVSYRKNGGGFKGGVSGSRASRRHNAMVMLLKVRGKQQVQLISDFELYKELTNIMAQQQFDYKVLPKNLIFPELPTSSIDLSPSQESRVHFKSGLALYLAEQQLYDSSNTLTPSDPLSNSLMFSDDFAPLSSTVMLSSDAQKVSNLSAIRKKTIMIDSLSLFLNHVAFGRQDKAEEMLCQNNDLVFMSGDVTDCAKRKFKQITSLQYAIWALDWHMWEMLKKYIPEQAICEQRAVLERGSWVKEHCTVTSWKKLIDVLQNYIDNYNSWTDIECRSYWSKQIGGEQLILPAHVIQEYCRPDMPSHRSKKCNVLLPRIDINERKNWFENNKGEMLGRDFGRVRGYIKKKNGNHRSIPVKNIKINEHWINVIKHDIKLLETLLNIRLQQRDKFIYNTSYQVRLPIELPVDLPESSVDTSSLKEIVKDKESSEVLPNTTISPLLFSASHLQLSDTLSSNKKQSLPTLFTNKCRFTPSELSITEKQPLIKNQSMCCYCVIC